MLRKTRVDLLTSLRMPAPIAQRYTWPTCVLCGRELDAIEMVEEDRPAGIAKVLGKHHGSEQLAELKLGTRTFDEEDIQRSVRNFPWFDPKEIVAQ